MSRMRVITLGDIRATGVDRVERLLDSDGEETSLQAIYDVQP